MIPIELTVIYWNCAMKLSEIGSLKNLMWFDGALMRQQSLDGYSVHDHD